MRRHAGGLGHCAPSWRTASRTVSTTTTTTMTTSGETAVAPKVHSLHQVGRMLRRLPVGRTRNTFFFNEMGFPVKMEVMAQLQEWRRVGQSDAVRARQSHWLEGRPILHLSAPRLGLPPERVLQHHLIATMKAAQKLVAREATSDHGDDGGRERSRGDGLRAALRTLDPSGEGQDTALVEPQVLVPQTEQERTMIGVRVVRHSKDHAVGKRGLPTSSLMLTTTCTTPRVDYAANPEVYVLGVPAELLERGYNGDAAAFLRQWTVKDLSSRLVLLVRPQRAAATRTEAGDGDATAAPVDLAQQVFLSQMFSFEPTTAHGTAMLALRGCGKGGARSPSYRLFFLCSHTATHKVPDPASTFPSAFTSYTVDLPTTTRLFHLSAMEGARKRGGGRRRWASTTFSSMGSSVEQYTHGALWTRLAQRRLTVRQDGGEGAETGAGANLWSTQLSPTGDKDARHLHLAKRKALTAPAPAGSEVAGAGARYLRAVDAGLRRRMGWQEMVDVAAAKSAAAGTTLDYIAASEGPRGGQDDGERDEAAASDSPQLSTTHATLFHRLFHQPQRRRGENEEEGTVVAPSYTTTVRGPRAAVHVFEAKCPPPPLSLPPAGSGGGASLEELVTHALYEGTVPAVTFHKRVGEGNVVTVTVTHADKPRRQRRHVLLPTALDSVLAVREGVMRPLLLAPVVAASTGADHARGRIDELSATSPDSQGRWLHRLGALERLTGWRRRGHNRRYGELGRLLGTSGMSSSSVSSPALLLGRDVAGRRGGPGSAGGPLVLLRDDVFVWRVLLPAMRVYAKEKYQLVQRAAGPGTAMYMPRDGPPVDEIDVAAAIHHRCLVKALSVAHARLRRERHGPFGAPDTDPSSSSASSDRPLAWPFLTRTLLSSSVTEADWAASVAVVPILPFLSWAADRFAEDAPTPAGAALPPPTFTAQDLVAALAYFSSFEESFEVGMGDRTTVAFATAACSPTPPPLNSRTTLAH